MQWWVTHSFKFLPSVCPHHTCTTSSSNNTSNILKQTLLWDASVSLLRFWWRSVARWTRVPFDISNLFGCSSHPILTSWGGPGLFGRGWWGAGGWLQKVFVCGGCLLLMLFDILAGVLSVWLLRCCSCSDILKGSSVWAAVNVCSFPSLSPYLSWSLTLTLSLF